MRVLWFANTPSNYSARGSAYNGTGWVSALETEISGKIELAVAFVSKMPRRGEPKPNVELGPTHRVAWTSDVQHGVKYYPIYNGHDRSRSDRMSSVFKGDSLQERDLVTAYWEIVQDFKPDVIQVFGSEHSYGLVAEKTKVPVVLHVQGIMNPYYKSFFPPGVGWREYMMTPFNPVEMLHKVYIKKKWERACERETRILKAITYYLGRTEWDHKEISSVNPEARFFYGGEILRQPFYDAEIDEISSIPSTLKLVTTISEPTYKGFDLVLRAGLILKKEYGLDFEWRVYGNVNPAFFEKITGITVEQAGITMSGVADADELVLAISRASMYVHPSYIDNSPNSVCEAQLLGAAVVATNVGGVSSLIEDGETGFLVRRGNAEEIAERIVAMYRNKALLRKVGHQARAMSLARHDRDTITADLIKCYKQIIDENR